MTASLLAFGSCPCICENVARAACTLWSRGSWLGGALVSALCLCCFMAHRLLYGIFVVLLFRSCFPLPYQSLRWYNVIISSCTFQMPVNWSADHRPCWFFVLFFGACVFGVLFFLFCCLPSCFARWQLNGLCIDPAQFSFVGTLSSWLMLPLP